MCTSNAAADLSVDGSDIRRTCSSRFGLGKDLPFLWVGQSYLGTLVGYPSPCWVVQLEICLRREQVKKHVLFFRYKVLKDKKNAREVRRFQGNFEFHLCYNVLFLAF